MPGLPRSIIKKYGVTKKAWEVFRSGRHRRGRSPSRSRLTMPRRRRRYAMAGRPRRFGRFRRHLAGKRVPISMIPSIAVPVGMMIAGDGELMGIAKATSLLASGDWGGFAKETINSVSRQTVGYTPYNNTWDLGIVGRNLALIIAGLAIHKAANYAGVNRYMAKIPMLGKYVSI